MAYAQQTALRTQETLIRLTDTWTALEASSTWSGNGGETSALPRRFAIKVFNVGTAGASRVALSYRNDIGIKSASHYVGSGQFIVEPASTGLTLYGRAKLASGINHIRVVVTEYGH